MNIPDWEPSWQMPPVKFTHKEICDMLRLDSKLCEPSGEEMTEPTMFDPVYRTGRHRVDDWATSIEGAKSVAYRAGSQKDSLLKAFQAAYPEGLTDEEAAVNSGVSLTSEYSKRCGELRQDGFISGLMGSNGTVSTRLGSSGVHRIVSAFIAKVGE